MSVRTLGGCAGSCSNTSSPSAISLPQTQKSYRDTFVPCCRSPVPRRARRSTACGGRSHAPARASFLAHLDRGCSVQSPQSASDGDPGLRPLCRQPRGYPGVERQYPLDCLEESDVAADRLAQHRDEVRCSKSHRHDNGAGFLCLASTTAAPPSDEPDGPADRAARWRHRTRSTASGKHRQCPLWRGPLSCHDWRRSGRQATPSSSPAAETVSASGSGLSRRGARRSPEGRSRLT